MHSAANGTRPSEPARVLLLLDVFGPAGAELQARLLLENLPRARVAAHVACYRAPAEILLALEQAGVVIELLPRPVRGLWPLQLVRHLSAMVRRRRIEILHVFLPGLAGIALPLRTAHPGLRVVTGRRSLDEYLSPRDLRILRWTRPWVAAVVANASAVADSVRTCEGNLKLLRVIPNALPLPPRIEDREREDARRRFHLDPNDFVVAHPAHFRHDKGYEHLPEIARRAVAACPRIRFLVAGDSTSNALYRRNHARFLSEVEAAGIAERVLYAGLLPESRPLLAAADAGANFSNMEGMSNTVMETMAASLPVVATAVGGTPELVRDGQEGWLVGRGDRIAAADRLVRLATDALECRRLGAAGRERIARDFSVLKMAEAYAGLYEELTRRRRRSAVKGDQALPRSA